MFYCNWTNQFRNLFFETRIPVAEAPRSSEEKHLRLFPVRRVPEDRKDNALEDWHGLGKSQSKR